LPLKSGSSSFRTDIRGLVLEVAGLASLGALAVALHAATRGRFHLPPGHQGLAWMVLVTIGRLTSRRYWAGVTTAAGAACATFLPFWRLGDPFLWLSYAVAGAVVDVGFATFVRSRRALWVIALIGGIAHATKPLIRSLIQFSGWRYDSLVAGLAFPVSTHFIFGALGALIGASLLRLRHARRETPTR
jgi:hypothetical protein